MDVIGKYIAVALASSLKFFAGIVTGFGLGLKWQETAFFTAIGMLIAVALVGLVGKFLQKKWDFYQEKKGNQKKIFTKNNRRAVKIWQKTGIVGIACLSPLLFTPIGGTLLALSFRVSYLKIISWMAFFAFFWAFLFCFIIEQFHFI